MSGEGAAQRSGERMGREMQLKIDGGEDFVLITPRILSSLIVRVRRHPERELWVTVREILSRELEEYLERLVNTNRHAAPCFRYNRIREEPITKKELHGILRGQLEGLEMNRMLCFHGIALADTVSGEAGFDIACTKPFFRACKDSAVRFVYSCPDGSQETLVLEYAEF